MENEIKTNVKAISEKLGTIVGRLASPFLFAWIAYAVYQTLATRFNLPTVSYWIILGGLITLRYIFASNTINFNKKKS